MKLRWDPPLFNPAHNLLESYLVSIPDFGISSAASNPEISLAISLDMAFAKVHVSASNCAGESASISLNISSGML